MIVTKHAARRIRQRVGLPRQAVERNAQAALEHGLRHAETAGNLHRYLQALYFKFESANNTRIYNDQVYIFHNEILITVFPLPQRYRNAVRGIFSKRRAST